MITYELWIKMTKNCQTEYSKELKRSKTENRAWIRFCSENEQFSYPSRQSGCTSSLGFLESNILSLEWKIEGVMDGGGGGGGGKDETGKLTWT